MSACCLPKSSSGLDQRMNNSACKDACPMKRPTRRPSVGSDSGASFEEEVLQLQHNAGAFVRKENDYDDDHSCSSEEDDNSDDDATQVTSNQKKDNASTTRKNHKMLHNSVSTGRTSKTTKSENYMDHEEPEDLPFPQLDLQSKPGLIAFNDFDEHLDEGIAHSRCLTYERVRSFMVDYYSDWDSIFQANNKATLRECLTAFVEQYYTEDVIWIRSTGNPLDKAGIVKLMVDDIECIRVDLVSIDSIQMLAGNMAAVVVFTADQEYKYKGKPESDRTVITAVLHMLNDGLEGSIKIGHEHRCVGKPIPKCTRWEP